MKAMHVGKEEKFLWKLHEVKTVLGEAQSDLHLLLYSATMQPSVWFTLPISNDESGLIALIEKMFPFLSHILS